jgi:FMN reductase
MTDRNTELNLVVVTAGLSEESSTRMLADRLAEAVRTRLEAAGRTVQVDVVELRPLAHAITDAMLTGFPSGDLAAAVESVRRADALVAVTPVFTASYSGLFKSFFDVLEPDLIDGLPVLVGATAGTARHSLVLEHALRPLFSYLRAVVVPTAVFAASEDWGGTREGALQQRIERAAGQLVDLLAGPSPRTAPADPFDDSADEFTDFASLLEG